MSFYGNLRTMSLPDLLQWASGNRMTGILELERNKICKRIAFREGRIVACSSEDPPALLGQFLLSRGKINRATLREALGRQEVSGENLGTILCEMGALTADELASQVAAKAEENIYGLFDWSEAIFRFLEDAPMDPYTIEVNLSVEDILLRGAQRRDELQRVRKVFHSSGIVLKHTGAALPKEIQGSPMAQRILQSINGERTVAEILLHAHASEYLVIKFLFMLHGRSVIEVCGERPIDSESPTLLDVPATGEAKQVASDPEEPKEPGEREKKEPGKEIERVVQLLADGDHAAALAILDGYYREHPGDSYARQLMFQAESGFLENVRKEKLLPTKVPVLLHGSDPADSSLQPNELFLLDMLDGNMTIQSIVWVAPLREVDVYRGLLRLLDTGVIALADAEGAEDTDAPVAAVQWSPF